MLEKDIQSQCLKWLEAKKVYAWRNNTTGVYDPKKKIFRKNNQQLKGVSDILGILEDGRFLAIEVKQPKKHPTDVQQSFLEAIHDRGGVSMCVHSLDELIEDISPFLAS